MNIKEQVDILKENIILEKENYYFISILGNENGTLGVRIISDIIEIHSSHRAKVSPVMVNPIALKNLLIDIGEPPLIINNSNELKIYKLFGGHAIMERKIFFKYCKMFIYDEEEVFLHPTLGKLSISDSGTELKRMPSKKLRMEIFKRDNRRCVICGRSPQNYVDLELHLHHITPYGQGGLSNKENLITLCKSCHDGLEPHYEPELYNYIEVKRASYYEGLKRYNEVMQKIIIESHKKKS